MLTPRHQQILDAAREDGSVMVDDLAQRFSVTPQTIRRDLTDLCAAGHLSRVHGGAVINAGRANIGYTQRRTMQTGAKDAIGALCAAALPSDCSLFLNIGTTTEAVARALHSHRDLMAITNNMNVANILAENEGIDIIVAGGALRRSDGGLVGEATVDFIRQFKVDFAIIGASAIDEDGTLLDYDYREVRVAQAIIANARRTYLVADATKFSRAAPVRLAQMTDLDAVFTDATPPESICNLCADNGIKLAVCAED